ncbi:MAG: hypothetical protein ACYC7E_08495 [Armatimonadota bacterium]
MASFRLFAFILQPAAFSLPLIGFVLYTPKGWRQLARGEQREPLGRVQNQPGAPAGRQTLEMGSFCEKAVGYRLEWVRFEKIETASLDVARGLRDFAD